MLNTDVKKQINTIRDILVGKIPDPKSQIDQITNGLVYKFMDDQDRLSQTLPGGKATFFVNELEPFAWHKLFDSKLSNQDRANLYVEGIAKLSRAKNLPDLFRDIFKDAFLPFRDADTIAMFINEINKFDYHHSEDLGNAFEYLLSIMGSQGDAGQFRTPRNIIEFIVDAVNPTKDEHILDPACGTAGFLVEAYKHITSDAKLSPNEVQELAKHIHGVDIDPGMGKIARVNLYLHGFKTPLITEDDTLTNDSLWGKKYDVILANPPFMTPKGGIKPHDKFSVTSNRAEVLFTDYIAEHLKLAGRAGIVVPEGIIFQSSNTYKQLRKMLVEDNYLWGVISLPAGVFNPYSGVKTSILLLDRRRAAENTEIMFYKAEDDGFGLGAQRRESKKNDLPEALKVIGNWREGKKLELSKVTYVEKEKIAEDGDYNLSVDRYQVAIDYSNAKWKVLPLKELEDLGYLTLGRGQVISKKDLEADEGIYPVYSSSAKENGEFGQYGKYMFDEELITWSIDGGGRFFYRPKHKFSVTNVCGWLKVNNYEKINPKFLYKVLNTEWQDKNFDYVAKAHPSVIRKMYNIPLPPLEIQEQIVAELDGYSAIISGAKQIVDNWKPKIDIDPEWEKVKLGNILETGRGRVISKIDIENNPGKYPVYSSQTTNNGEFGRIATFDFEGEYITWTTDGANAGTVFYRNEKFNCTNVCGTAWPKTEYKGRVHLPFLAILANDFTAPHVVRVGNPKLMNKNFERIEIPLPSLEIQKQTVEKIESERELVESAKKLIDIYEDRIKEVVDGLWSE